jgi:uncharacterized peroxidase-related enzyme
MTTERFAPVTAATASSAARAMIAASTKQFGFLPSPIAKAARSPVLLKHLLAGFGAFDRSSLSAIEREVVAFTVAFEIECHYCMALHTALNAAATEHESLIAALRDGTSLADPRLEALRQFARDLVRMRGRVPEERWQVLERAGFSEEQALDVLLGVGVYLLSTLTNVVTGAELDPPFVPFRWNKPKAV